MTRARDDGRLAPGRRPEAPRESGRLRGGARLAAVAVVLTLFAAIWAGVAPARAGVLDRERLAAFVPPELRIGEKDDKVPVWPIFKQTAGTWDLVAYLFESADLAPIPGFSGTPPNLLVALAPDGTFRQVRVLSHHEPVFLEGLGEEPLLRFVEQYEGLSLRSSIKVGPAGGAAGGRRGASAAVVVDGVAKATASTTIVNAAILASSLAVARAKLGYAAGLDPSVRVTAKPDVFLRKTWPQLVAEGLVSPFRFSNREVERAFAGSAVEGVDPEALAAPDAAAVEGHVAYLNAPTIGRAVLGDDGYARLMAELDVGQHAILVSSRGRWSALGEDFVRGAVPDRIAVRQGGLQIEARDMAVSRRPAGAGVLDGEFTVLRVRPEAGLDPSSPWTVAFKVTREKGQIFPERISHDFEVPVTLPAALFDRQGGESRAPWIDAWVARAPELALLTLALGALTVGLTRQERLVAHARRFAAFRWAFLAFTLLFVGWYAQAQLSIVTLNGLVKAAIRTHDLAFLVYDPPSLVLWVYVLATLVVWGRGTFCGWLCPFGALQEFVAALARPLRIRQVAVPARWDRRLRGLKYGVLAGAMASAVASSSLAEAVAEVEPFKTAITLAFLRSWPFVLYAVGLLVANLFVYKTFCRYLCPLGAALAVLGRLRALDWIPRRVQCGSPCQLCKVRCRYGAIARDGRIDYPECFHCLDCVAIHDDPRQCVPLVLQGRAGARRRMETAA